MIATQKNTWWDELESHSGEKKRERECGGKLAARDTAYRVRWLCLATLVLLALTARGLELPLCLFIGAKWLWLSSTVNIKSHFASWAMYWPNGVPRVYAVNGPDITHVSSDGYTENTSPNTERGSSVGNNDESEDAQSSNNPSNEPNPKLSSESTLPKWEHEPINGLCVSRSGHMFATITESSISLWQTRVRLGVYSCACNSNCGLGTNYWHSPRPLWLR